MKFDYSERVYLALCFVRLYYSPVLLREVHEPETDTQTQIANDLERLSTDTTTVQHARCISEGFFLATFYCKHLFGL